MIPLSLVWHQHQPYYKDLASGELVLPWVRLHGVKDYYGMARLISEFPGVKCAVNLVPSMLEQLEDYVARRATDPFLRRTEIYADALNAEDACFLLDHFFMAQWDRMIRVHPRYDELLGLRMMGRRDAIRALENYKENDLRDLQVWFNLAWFHPVSFEESETLRELRKKGRDFSEDDKTAMLNEQRHVLAQVIPLHRELADRGQVELTTTPFYHPILPLLCDMHSALEGMPETALPSGHVPLLADAEAQVKKAVDYHRELFGHAPEGMWPSEGSVSPAMVPIVAAHGIKWIATDEEILGASLKERIRGDFAKLARPDLLYRPWRCDHNGAHVNMLFRDHHLSDMVGFHYQSWDGAAAADDFIKQIHESAKDSPAGGETLATVILDGENCWEHYPDHGIDFLRGLYAKLEKNEAGIKTVRPGEFVREHPPTHHIERLYSGSWINHDFYIWVGHAEDRRAWEYVYRTREDLVQAQKSRGADPQQDMAFAHAWEELYIAEGSDWFWWYGDDHNSGNDDAFDSLFRKHLSNVYTFIGQPAPYFLSEPVKGRGRAGRYSLPTGSINARIDGRTPGYFDWIGAGRYRPDKDGGVMTAAGRAPIQQIFFGYGGDSLFIRADLIEDVLNPLNAAPGECATVRFIEPRDLSFEFCTGRNARMVFEGMWKDPQRVQVAWNEILELKIPFDCLGVLPGKELAFYLEFNTEHAATERFPRSSPFQFTVPQANSDLFEWMA